MDQMSAQSRRRKQAAAMALREAARIFGEVGTPLWASRAQDKLGEAGSRTTRAQRDRLGRT